MLIVPFYAAVLVMMFVLLSIRTLRIRRRLQISVGDAGNETMLRAMRAHGNFAEYVPISLLIFYFAELLGAPVVLVHALGVSLLLGRVAHAYGVSQVNENYMFRVFGMTVTFTAMLSSAGFVLYRYTGLMGS